MATAKFKISDLTGISDVSDDDLLIINDSDGPETKSVTFGALKSYLLGGDGSSNGALEVEPDITFKGNVTIEAERLQDQPQTADANLNLKFADIIMEDQGPHSIRFRDLNASADPDDPKRIQNSMDLTWRSNPNTLGFELANDEPAPNADDPVAYLPYRVFETYLDNPDGFDVPPFGQIQVPRGTTVFHANLVVDSRDNLSGLVNPNTNLTILDGNIILRSGGPHKIRFIDNSNDLNEQGFDVNGYTGQVSPASLVNSIDLTWRDNCNLFCFEQANGDSNQDMMRNNRRVCDFSVDTKVSTFHGQLHYHFEDVPEDTAGTNIQSGEVGAGSGEIQDSDLFLCRGGFYMDGNNLKFKYKALDGSIRTYTITPDS